MHQGKTDCVYIFQIICSYLFPDQVIHFSYFQRFFGGEKEKQNNIFGVIFSMYFSDYGPDN